MAGSAFRLKQSDENILKTIKETVYEKGTAYVSDLANTLGINKNTMYAAVNKLIDKGYIQPMGPKGGRNENHNLRLTKYGEKIADSLIERHRFFESALIRLGMSPEQANKEACGMEHGVSDAAFELIRGHVLAREQGMPEDMSAEEIQKLRSTFEHVDPANSMQTTRMQRAIEQLGGIEGAMRKKELNDRFGGDENLSKLADAIDAAGGTKSAMAQLEAMHDYVETLGSAERAAAKLNDLKPLMEQNVNAAEVNALADLVRKYGSIRQIYDLLEDKEEVVMMRNLGRRYGGARKLASLAYEADKVGGVDALRRFFSLSKPFGGPAYMLTALGRALPPLERALQSEPYYEEQDY